MEGLCRLKAMAMGPTLLNASEARCWVEVVTRPFCLWSWKWFRKARGGAPPHVRHQIEGHACASALTWKERGILSSNCKARFACWWRPLQGPLSTTHFACLVSFELHDSFLRANTVIRPILEKETEAQRGIAIGLVSFSA